jgi:hypothetical protein
VTLRPDLAALVEALVRGTSPGDSIELDAIGEAIGARAIAQDEIDGVLAAIEARGRKVTTAQGGHGEATLRKVIDSARTLRAALDRPPRPDEIAAHAALTLGEVQHALALVKIMQR